MPPTNAPTFDVMREVRMSTGWYCTATAATYAVLPVISLPSIVRLPG